MLSFIKQSHKPDIFINVGDMGELLLQGGDCKNIIKVFKMMLNTMKTLYVPGNHDLYARPKLMPDDALFQFVNKLNSMNFGTPLQTRWDDAETIVEVDDCVFCGAMGWPDFTSKRLMYPPSYYEKIAPTVDSKYIDLIYGWQCSGQAHYQGFDRKLDAAFQTDKPNIVVVTHYSILEGQYVITNDDVSAYFFCETMGQMVKQHAERHPDKRVFCVSGHGHEFNLGEWKREGDNLFALGLKTTYNTQDFFMLDTEQNFTNG